MAKDFRETDSGACDLKTRRSAIIDECRRQEESCLYTSTTLFIWLSRVRLHRRIFVIAPVVLGGLAGFSLLQESLPHWFIAVLAFLASLFPAMADALKFETSVDEIARLGAEFKALQDRFRRCATITALGDVDVADETLSELMERLDIARGSSTTPPEWAFVAAKKKIDDGHYSFGVDSRGE